MYTWLMNNDQSAGFEYRNKTVETPFETFLRYTDEKEKSSEELAKVLQAQANGAGLHILDIGTGNGEYLALTLSKMQGLSNVKLTLLEPSGDLVKQLKDRFSKLLPESQVTVTNTNLEAFSTGETFDIVLASHLFYHITKHDWPLQLGKMLALLKPGGKLIIVLREKDDAYDFKMAFKPLLFGEDFKALILDDVLAALPDTDNLHVTRYTAKSTLKIPAESNNDDTVAIIEFYLNKQWQGITKSIQHDALEFINKKDNTFEQLDGIAVIEKT